MRFRFQLNKIIPCIIIIPENRNGSATAGIVCEKDAAIRYARVKLPYGSTANMLAVGASGRLLGKIKMVAIEATRDRVSEDWGYKNASIIFDERQE
jgi:hypothetical protein